MDGEGGEAIEPRGRGATGADLPSLLAQLDDHVSTEQRTAVRRIRTAIDERGQAAAYVPTVPKLRSLLEQPDLDFRDEVAACLAELAAEAPTDVAPSTGTIAAVAREQPDQPMTRELLRCLAAVAAERPDVVAAHTDAIAEVLEQRRGHDRLGLKAIADVSREEPAAVEPAAAALTDALAANPVENGGPTLRALGRLARSDATVPSFEFVTHAAALVECDDRSLRHDALGCLAGVAHDEPAAVEPVCDELGSALSCADPDTRAIATITIARVAAGVDTAVDPVRGELLELLTDEHAHVRANACVALGHGHVDTALPHLRELARTDPAANVRDRANRAIRRLS